MTIDVCKLYGPDTVFLQQAAHLTGGSYLYLEHKEALLQYLIVSHCETHTHIIRMVFIFYVMLLYSTTTQMTFLPPPRLRQFLATPTQDKVDFRAACFCHKNIVDIGFVCSVCLSSEIFLLLYCFPPSPRRPFLIGRLFTVFCQPVPVCSTCR